MELPQWLNTSLIVAFGLLMMYWTISQSKKKASQQQTQRTLKNSNTPPVEEIVDHVTLESIQGLWRMISVGRNGNFAPQKVIESSNFIIAIVSNTLTITSTLKASTLELNNSVVPNELDQTDDDGDTHLCIVRLRNNHLEMCQGDVGKPRPSDFNRQRRDGASLVLFERVANPDELG